jgi:GDP-L-fucose synthase
MKIVFETVYRDMMGSDIVRHLEKCDNIQLILRSRDKLDFSNEDIDEVYLAAAKVGGIYANNTYPDSLIYENQMIECSIIHTTH